MKQSLPLTLKKTILCLAAVLILHSAFAQAVPELVFRNPVLEQGVDGEDGAVYRFNNVTGGIDGLLKIKKRSDPTVILEAIDVADLGWDKALQPRLGISGRMLANEIWWMQFELTFVQSNSTNKVKLSHFAATPIDVDGDNVAVREFVQMDEMKDIAYSSLTRLENETILSADLHSTASNIRNGEDHGFNPSGSGSVIVGPVTSFAGMDTAATAVMATYTYENKDAITFTMGVTSYGAVANPGMVGLRLNSIWFKSFDLAPQNTLPVNVETFLAMYTGKTIRLSWKTASKQDVSHFVVERSVDGRTYSDIALIPATDSNGEATYSYKDKPVSMPAGIAYYRLRIVDKHRSTAHSSVSAVYAKDTKNANKVVVASNATTGGMGIGLLGKVKR